MNSTTATTMPSTQPSRNPMLVPFAFGDSSMRIAAMIGIGLIAMPSASGRMSPMTDPMLLLPCGEAASPQFDLARGASSGASDAGSPGATAGGTIRNSGARDTSSHAGRTITHSIGSRVMSAGIATPRKIASHPSRPMTRTTPRMPHATASPSGRLGMSTWPSMPRATPMKVAGKMRPPRKRAPPPPAGRGS